MPGPYKPEKQGRESITVHAPVFILKSYCAEDTVTGVAQAGDDIAVLVQLLVQCADIDVHIGVGLMQSLQTLRGSNQTDELDVLGTTLLDLAMASQELPPVASIGSRTKTSRSLMSLGSLQ